MQKIVLVGVIHLLFSVLCVASNVGYKTEPTFVDIDFSNFKPSTNFADSTNDTPKVKSLMIMANRILDENGLRLTTDKGFADYENGKWKGLFSNKYKIEDKSPEGAELFVNPGERIIFGNNSYHYPITISYYKVSQKEEQDEIHNIDIKTINYPAPSWYYCDMPSYSDVIITITAIDNKDKNKNQSRTITLKPAIPLDYSLVATCIISPKSKTEYGIIEPIYTFSDHTEKNIYQLVATAGNEKTFIGTGVVYTYKLGGINNDTIDKPVIPIALHIGAGWKGLRIEKGNFGNSFYYNAGISIALK